MIVTLLSTCEPPLRRPNKALLSLKKLGPCARTRTRTAQVVQNVMTVRLGPLFSFTYSPSFPLPLHYHTMDPPLSLLIIALSWTYLLTPRLGQGALQTVRLLPYLLHALSSLLLYSLRVHQYLLMCTLCAPFVPVPPHHCLMYHCTFCARFLTP